jgi:hypothetical protein
LGHLLRPDRRAAGRLGQSGFRLRARGESKPENLLYGLIPDAQIRIYPDAAHGFLFQYPTDVAAEVNVFLERSAGQ